MKELTNKKIHYAWIIMIGCGLVTFYSVGLAFNCLSVYLNPLMESLGISNTLRSSMAMFYQVGSLLSLFTINAVIKKIGTRRSVLYSSLLMSAGYLILAAAKYIVICYVAMLIIGIGYGLCSLVPVSLLLTEWFAEKRGLAMGIAMCGSGLSTIMAPAMVTKAIYAWGVNSAFILQAAIITICAVLAFVLLRDKPADLGILPYGDKAECIDEKKDPSGKQNANLWENINDIRFVMLAVATFLAGCLIAPTVQHLSPFVSQSGYSGQIAATAVSLYGFVMLLGKPVFGTILDRLGVIKGNTYGYMFLISALISGVFLSKNIALVYALPFCLGMGSAPMVTVGLPMWVTEIFGKEKMPGVFSLMRICYTFGGLVGASVPGIVMDCTGSYTALFKLYIVMAVLSYIILQRLCIKSSKKSERKET